MQIKRDFFVNFRSVDADLRLTNGGILAMFEDIACLHGVMIGDDISVSDLRWLLIGYRVNVIRRPKYGAEVRVTTWSKDYRNVTATREFEMHDTDGQLLVTGWSSWARVNIKTRELVRLTDESMAAYQSEPEHTNFGKAPRISEPTEHSARTDMVIDWRWMDGNCHMHNSYYLDVAERVLPPEVRAQLAECSFDVSYKQEIPENAAVACLYSENEKGWTVTFKSEDLSVLHAVVIFRRPQGDGEESAPAAAELTAASLPVAKATHPVTEEPAPARKKKPGFFLRKKPVE